MIERTGGWGRWAGAPLALMLGAMASPALAEAPSCRLPADIPPARRVTPPAGEASRSVPVAGYMLALSWSPEYCRGRDSRAEDRLQCGSGNRFGFILHGLWPEASGATPPRWCRPAEPLPPALVRQHLCETPSVQLLQREWAKHGTCAARSPTGYLRAGSMLYRAVRYPDMDALSRLPLTIAAFRLAFAERNRLKPAAVAIDANERGWLREVRICLDARMRPRDCPTHARGDRGDAPLKIWRGGR